MSAGQELTGINVAIKRVPTVHVAGRWTKADGSPGSGRLQITGVGIQANLSQGAAIAANGEFVFDSVAPGTYVIEGSRGMRTQSTEGEVASVIVNVTGTNIDDVVLRMTSGSVVQGRVTFDSVNNARPSANTLEIAAVLADPDMTRCSCARALVGPSWTFQLSGLSGRRRLAALRVPSGWAVEDVRVDGISATDSPITFGASADRPVDVEVVLTDRVSTTTGRVLDARARQVAGTRVVVFSTDRSRWYDRSRYINATLTATDGRYTITGLPFDSYYVVATSPALDGDADAWRDPTVLESLVPTASTVVVREGEPTAIDVRVRD